MTEHSRMNTFSDERPLETTLCRQLCKSCRLAYFMSKFNISTWKAHPWWGLWGPLHRRSCRHSSFNRFKMRFGPIPVQTSGKRPQEETRWVLPPPTHPPGGHEKNTEQHTRIRRKLTSKHFIDLKHAHMADCRKKSQLLVEERECWNGTTTEASGHPPPHPLVSLECRPRGGGLLVDVAARRRLRELDWAKCTSGSAVMDLCLSNERLLTLNTYSSY